MGRDTHPYRIKQRNGVWYYKLRGESTFHTTRVAVDNPKSTQRKAEKFCEHVMAVSTGNRGIRNFGEYAEPYFKEGSCPWYSRQIGKGKRITIDTRKQHRSRLEIHILPQFKSHWFHELSPMAIEKWVFSLNYASQTKKHIYNTFKIIIRDMFRDKLIGFSQADIDPPVVRNKEREILTDTDAVKLFPDSLDDFRRVWGQSYSIGVFTALLYSTGLRTSEARALPPEAVNWKFRGIKIIQTINKDNVSWVPKGKGIRVVPLPKKTIALLKVLPSYRKKTGLIFPGRTPGNPLDIGSAAHAFKRIRERLGISANVTPHGLRHTYNTRMRAILANAVMSDHFSDVSGFLSATEATDKILRAFTGHKTPNMTELYDHPELDKKLEFVNRNFQDYVEQIWDIYDQQTDKVREAASG